MAGKKSTKRVAKDESSEEEDDVFEVQAIKDHKRTKSGLSYLVRWKGYGEGDDTWEGEDNVATASEAIEKYWKKLPADQQGQRYKPNSKEHKAFLAKQREGKTPPSPSKKRGRKSGASAAAEESEQEEEEEEPKKAKRGRKSAGSANGSSAKKQKTVKAAAASDEEDEEEEPAPAAAKKEKKRAPAKKVAKKQPSPSPEPEEQEDEEMVDQEFAPEDEQGFEVGKELVDWEEHYAGEENWENLISSIVTVEMANMPAPDSPSAEGEQIAASAGGVVVPHKDFRMMCVWKTGTAAYKPKPAAVPAAEGAGSPAKAAKADGDEGEQVQLAEDGKTVEAADVAMDGAAPAEGEKKDAATEGDKPEEKEKEKENGAAAADIPDPNPAGAAKDPSADDEPVALKDDGKT
ncbi:hypothetical protein JCM10213_007559, partial [Rhodosporidiobolus nylandii]